MTKTIDSRSKNEPRNSSVDKMDEYRQNGKRKKKGAIIWIYVTKQKGLEI